MTTLMTLSETAGQQANPTKNTEQRVQQFLDYMATHPNAIIRYYSSDMMLNVHSDASHLTTQKARSRAGGPFSWDQCPRTTNQFD